jgi:hypothetical protein
MISLHGVFSKKNIGEVSPRGIINLKHFDYTNSKDEYLNLNFTCDERRKAEFNILADSFATLNKKFSAIIQSPIDT